MMLKKHKAKLIGAACALGILIVGLVAFKLMQPKHKVIAGGSVLLQLDSVDRQFLDQMSQIPSPQAADPSFGGSSAVQQSPQYSVDTWKHLLQNELQ